MLKIPPIVGMTKKPTYKLSVLVCYFLFTKLASYAL
jgi:hypothetical protein